ncbi:MAG TPA: hypothetical protein DIC35_01675 [Candidatus Moranbacteria bacterium]|nr:hypothetical protein [Candidatus Moranbacteria bacterium]
MLNVSKMSILSQIMTKSFKIKAVIAIVITATLIVPGFVLSSHKTKIYVNDDATGTQDGSINHPYRTIKQAMEAASKNSEIHVSKGTYEENVDIKKGVDIFGESKSGVVIKADDKGEAVVKMSDDTTLDKVTVEKGRYGVRVKDGAKVSISQCIIKENSKNGIFIEKDSVKKSRMVSISESEIKDNDGTGIYSERRKLSITDNEIRDNDGDGIDIEDGSSAWIADNSISSNDKSGMKLRIDGSEIWTKSNSIKDNDREGIEISYKGSAGRINIAKTKIMNNKKFGIAKVQRFVGNYPSSAWNKYLTFDTRNSIAGNGSGNISPVIIVK